MFPQQVEEIIWRTDSIHLVLELMSGGDLATRLSGKRQLTEVIAKYYFLQLVLAVEYCHQTGVVHRDLIPENILLSSKEEDTILKVHCCATDSLID